jgi:hypothetical protein
MKSEVDLHILILQPEMRFGFHVVLADLIAARKLGLRDWQRSGTLRSITILQEFQ